MGINNSKTLNYLAKAVGVGAVGLIAYDAHHAGVIKARRDVKDLKAKDLSERFLDDLKMEQPSVVTSAAKKGIFRYFVDENISGFFNHIGGYAKGFGSMFVGNFIPLLLAAGTFAGSKGIRGGFSKFCGAGLLAYGGIFLAQEVLGIGKSHN